MTTTTLITPAPATPALDSLELAEAVARDGVEAHLGAVCSLAMTARDLGVADVLVGIVVDEAAPAVARERAFGRLLVALAR
jgi:hypothetical protein